MMKAGSMTGVPTKYLLSSCCCLNLASRVWLVACGKLGRAREAFNCGGTAAAHLLCAVGRSQALRGGGGRALGLRWPGHKAEGKVMPSELGSKVEIGRAAQCPSPGGPCKRLVQDVYIVTGAHHEQFLE